MFCFAFAFEWKMYLDDNRICGWLCGKLETLIAFFLLLWFFFFCTHACKCTLQNVERHTAVWCQGGMKNQFDFILDSPNDRKIKDFERSRKLYSIRFFFVGAWKFNIIICESSSSKMKRKNVVTLHDLVFYIFWVVSDLFFTIIMDSILLVMQLAIVITVIVTIAVSPSSSEWLIIFNSTNYIIRFRKAFSSCVFFFIMFLCVIFVCVCLCFVGFYMLLRYGLLFLTTFFLFFWRRQTFLVCTLSHISFTFSRSLSLFLFFWLDPFHT